MTKRERKALRRRNYQVVRAPRETVKEKRARGHRELGWWVIGAIFVMVIAKALGVYA